MTGNRSHDGKPARRSATLAAAALLVFFVHPFPDLPQDAIGILRKVGNEYTNVKSYDFEGNAQLTVKVDGIRYRMTVPQSMAQGDAPDLGLANQFRLPTWQKADGTPQGEGPPVRITTPSLDIYQFARLPEGVKSAQ